MALASKPSPFRPRRTGNFRRSERSGLSAYVILTHPDGRHANVPMHARHDVPRDLLAAILSDFAMTRDEQRTFP